MMLLNAFSISMLGPHEWWQASKVSFQRIPLQQARILLNDWEESTPDVPEGRIVVDSVVGHEATARILSRLLNADVAVKRQSVIFHDECVVAQYVGPRLPEGATELPEGAEIQWFHVRRFT